MAFKNMKNIDSKGLSDLPKDKKVNPYILTQRQHLIQKLSALLYDVQRSKVSDDKVSEILKLLSHI